MDIGSTSSRRLNFEYAHGDMVDEGSMNQLVNLTSMNNKEDTPKIGMSFDTEEDAYEFYLKYSKRVGFGIRRSKSHKNTCGELVDRIFCCSAQGKRSHDKRDVYVKKARPETRFDCQAKLKISSRETGKLCVVQFVEEHNHYLSSPNKIHLHRSHRKIAPAAALQIQMANDVGITPKASHDLMARQVGGRENLGFIPEDYKNYLRSKRTRDSRIGDTGGVLEYLQQMQFDDPNFFYAIQVDEDDLITNIFWADAKMRTDYSHFGDVTVVFGAALLYDETSVKFEWLFDTFTRAMGQKKPITILTDQDAAMAKALSSIWPETHHRLCLWHICHTPISEGITITEDFGSVVVGFRDFVVVALLLFSLGMLQQNALFLRNNNKHSFLSCIPLNGVSDTLGKVVELSLATVRSDADSDFD
ncbi:protein FAR1-RELATED SEQUENCE 5-like [Salvia miltiorrhiza]|uniref:protein FAR1-RELATED SEQUENCE 5-like n=1 Tax=Salvia miltiorrhiza TaxID=226208 RepID=UPI0025AB6B6F|nr:protein FAR1-RELATED SEQUENCE 5-like [Salvia miltiorrhiza]